MKNTLFSMRYADLLKKISKAIAEYEEAFDNDREQGYNINIENIINCYVSKNGKKYHAYVGNGRFEKAKDIIVNSKDTITIMIADLENELLNR